MQFFEMVDVTTKKGITTKRLRAVSCDANMTYITNFIDKLIVKFIHHRNLLKHYRSVIHSFREQFDSLWIDIDLAENLKVPVKEEPQSQH